MGLGRRLFGRGRKPDGPILIRDPARPNEIPDDALAGLVRGSLKGDEIIFHWSELRRGEVTVDLISAELDRVCEEISARCDPTGEFGREGGGGRSLCFVYRDDRWELAGIGDWIS